VKQELKGVYNGKNLNRQIVTDIAMKTSEIVSDIPAKPQSTAELVWNTSEFKGICALSPFRTHHVTAGSNLEPEQMLVNSLSSCIVFHILIPRGLH
jgi:hypothetical protein